MHCELRRSGLKTYKMNKKPITNHDIESARKAVIDDVLAWDIDNTE
jgi:hypothetical protein